MDAGINHRIGRSEVSLPRRLFPAGRPALAVLAVLVLILPADAQPTPSPALLVLAKQDQTLAIVDPATLKVVARVPTGPDPHEVVASDDGRRAYVSNYGFGAYHTIAEIDVVAQKALAPIDVGVLRSPHGLAWANGKLYFTAEINKIVGRYDPATRQIDWLLGTGQNRTHMVAISPDRNHLYTSNVVSGTISIFDRTADPEGGSVPGGPHGMPPVPAGMAPPPPPPPGRPTSGWTETVLTSGPGSEGFDVSPNGQQLWAANAGDGTLTIIDPVHKEVLTRLQANVPGANRLKFTPDGKRVLVSSLRTGEVAVFDVASRKPVTRIKVGRGAAGILMQPDGLRAYVACSPDANIAVIDLKTLRVVGRIETGRGPDGMAWAVRSR
jgi:YVTN family beta-propeller protein